MDSSARQALEQIVRQVAYRDIDRLTVELDRQRRQLLALRAAVGLPVDPPESERREHVVEMRRAGMSTRAIALAIGVHRATVAADLRAVAAPRPDRILGLDGRVTRGPRPPANGQQPAG